MTIQSAALPITDITIPVPNIHAHLAGASIAIHGDWHYKLHSLWVDFDGLVQERRNSSALAMELRLSCTKPSF